MSQMQDRLVTVSFKIYASQLAEIDILCSKLGISRSEFIKRALKEYVEKVKQIDIQGKKIIRIYKWICPICNNEFKADHINTLKAGVITHLKKIHGISVDKNRIVVEKQIIEVI